MHKGFSAPGYDGLQDDITDSRIDWGMGPGLHISAMGVWGVGVVGWFWFRAFAFLLSFFRFYSL